MSGDTRDYELLGMLKESESKKVRLAALREVREIVHDLPVHLEPTEVCKFIDALIKREEEK